MEPGEWWGYRSRSGVDLVEVEVLRLGTKRPARVQVRFVDLEQEGREEWVPPARLKVPWRQAPAFMARDRRWEAARELSVQVRDTTPHYAASRIIDDVADAEMSARTAPRSADTGLLLVSDLGRLLAEIGWTREQFVGQPAVFYDEPERVWVAPWPVTEAVARALAPARAEALLAELAAEERKAEHDSIYGHTYGRGRTAWSISPESCAEVDAEHSRPIRELIRCWCGHEVTDRRDELQALRGEVQRLATLVTLAVAELRGAGESRAAARLEKQLGVHLPAR